MAYIEVELDDFDTLELIGELAKRLRKKRRGGLTTKEYKEAQEDLTIIGDAMGVAILPVHTMDDRSKVELFGQYGPKYTAAQFEERLK